MQQTVKVNSRNPNIDYFRLVCALLVVAIHAHPFTDVHPLLGNLATNVIPRIAVPFFFAAAGYYFIKSLRTGRGKVAQYVLRLLLLYIIWTVFYLLIDINHAVQTGRSVIRLFRRLWERFFFIGSVSHLWFFPAIIISALITAVSHKLKLLRFLPWAALAVYLFGCLCTSYSALARQIPVLKVTIQHPDFNIYRRIFMMGLPFFTMGYYLGIEGFYKKSIAHIRLLLPFSVFLWALEVFLIRYFQLGSNIIITPFLYPMLMMVLVRLLYGPHGQYGKAAAFCRIAANFTYYAHPYFMTLVKAGSTTLYLFACACSLVGGFIIYKANSKILNRLVM
ncbi:MAG TPA: acyltransferase [Clostridiales bacterium]|nr:acyltransferase [Clostridiales bacterium]